MTIQYRRQAIYVLVNKIVDVVSRRAAEWKAANVVGELGHVDRVQLPELDEFGRQDGTNNLDCTVYSSMIGDVVRDKAVGQQGVSFAGDHQIECVANFSDATIMGWVRDVLN